MRFRNFVFLLGASVLLATGCSSSVKPTEKTTFEGTFTPAGLEGIRINNYNTYKGSIYASTIHGLYEKSPGSSSWASRGLQQNSVLDVVFLPNSKLLAAIHIPNFSETTPSLFLSSDHGQTWEPHMGNYGGENGKYTLASALAAASKPSNMLFTQASGGVIARSLDGGKSWENVQGEWSGYGGLGAFVLVDPYTKGRVWAGGENAFLLPVLYKSKDGGKSWQSLDILSNIEAICWDIIINPVDANDILIGLSGTITKALKIRKSSDRGENWRTVFEGIGTRTLAHSARDPQVVYASGRNPAETLFFAASADFGDTWQTIEMESSPTGIYVNDMVSVMQDRKEVLYLGTNKGVYSYTFKQ